jgi:acyl-CoA reductase-like NAD-dependent aldehyde dehydrogenase
MGLMTRLVVVNPATEEVLAELPQSTVEEIRATIDKAYDAFLKWSETPLKTRTKLLLKAAELLEAGEDAGGRVRQAH